MTHRTPGFVSWQEGHWLAHCGDAAVFLGRIGWRELRRYPEALEMVLHENDVFGWDAERSGRYIRSPEAEGDATGYLFQCLVCARYLAYTDMS